jgi:hypothetical protein
MIYKDKYDTPLKAAIKNRRNPSDTMQLPGIAEIITELDEQYETEKQQAAEKEKETGELSMYGSVEKPPAEEVDDQMDSDVLGAAAVAKDIADLKSKVADEQKAIIDSFFEHASTLRKTHCAFIPEQSSDEAMGLLIKQTAAGRVLGDPSKGQYIYIPYDIADSGETISHPHTRVAPLRSDHLKKMCRSVMIAREMTDLHPGDCYNIFDGGNHGNQGHVLNQFVTDEGQLVKQKRTLYIMYVESSITNRYKKHKTGPVQQEEYVWQISKEHLTLNGRKSLHFEGTNRGTLLGPLASVAPTCPATWRMTKEMKKEIFGKDNRIAVGGPGPAGSDEVAEAFKTEDGKVPVFWHTKPTIVPEELIHRLDSPATIELTAADGKTAVHCVRMRKPYCGVCFTEAHVKALEARTDHMIFRAMQDSEDILYQPALVEAMTAKKKRAKAKAKAKTKPGKAGKTNGDDDDAEEEDEEEDEEDEEAEEEEDDPPPNKKAKTDAAMSRSDLLAKLKERAAKVAVAKGKAKGKAKAKAKAKAKTDEDEEEEDEDEDEEEEE